MQISYLKKSKLVSTEFKDFVSENVEADEKHLIGLKKKRKLTLIGLGAFYIGLLLISLFIIT